MSLIDMFKEFHRDAIQQEFPPSTRVLFDTLLFKFDAAYRTDELVFSERELIQLTGLKKTTLHEAKHFLASRHIITCKTFKGKTAYSLGDNFKKFAPTGNRPPTDQLATTFRDTISSISLSSINTSRDNILDTTHKQRASACVKDVNSLEEIETFEDFVDFWEKSGGCKLNMLLLSKLEMLWKKNGLVKMKKALSKANSDSNGIYGFSLKFFELKLTETPEGGEKNAKTEKSATFKKPVRTGNEPWANRTRQSGTVAM